MAIDFDAIPRSVVDGGSVRFFPRTDSVKPITGYDWDFGDGTAHGTDATPIHVYAGTGSYTTYNVVLVITYTTAPTETKTNTSFISTDLTANIPAVVADGSHIATSVFLYDGATNYMLANRLAWTGSHYYLQNPTVTSSIDRIGTARFTLIDPGDSTADEQLLVAEGINVIIIMGKSVIFSGVVRRITQSVQAAFLATVKIRVWDFECDSDLIRLQKTNVTSSALVTDGAPLYYSPGYLARRILTPSGTRDSRGVINCVDAKMSYQLNSSTVAESVGNQNDHLTTIHSQTNYDLRARPDYLMYMYTSFDAGTGVVTVTTSPAITWTPDEFIGDYLFFVGRPAASSQTFTTDYASSTSEILVSSAPTYFAVNDRVNVSTTNTLPDGLLATTTYYVKVVTADHLILSLTLAGTPVTFSTDGTGTHSIIRTVETAGVTTYGKITDNGATTITATLVGASTAPTTYGYFIIHRGYLIDFAHDISPPSPLTNLDVNKTCFEYSDNDDKRKLSTKIVATGKDLQGKTISVSVAGVHAYDNTTQFFEDSTYITKNSEGYIYKNNFVLASQPVTAKVSGSQAFTTSYTSGTIWHYVIWVPNGTEIYYPDNSLIWFDANGGTLPSGISPGTATTGTRYYVRDFEVNSPYSFSICATPGGAAIDIGSNKAGTPFVISSGGLVYNNASYKVQVGEGVRIFGTTQPGNLTAGTVYYCGLNYSAGNYYMTLYSDKALTTLQTVGSSAGSGVYIVRENDLKNVEIGTTPTVQLYGWGIIIPTSTVMAFYIPGSGSLVSTTTSGATSETISINGNKVTSVPMLSHPTYDFSGRGFLLSPRLYVADRSVIGNNPVLIGEEAIAVTANNTSATYGDYIDVTVSGRVTSATKKCYPHGVGALVARTNYDEANPQPGAPIAPPDPAYPTQCGLYIDYRTVDSNITYGDLDAYATSLLLGLGNFYGKATTWSPLEYAVVKEAGVFYKGAQASRSRFIMIGDSITITNFDGDDPSEPYEVVETTIICNEGRMTMQLGDFEKNAYTTLMSNTNAINNTLT